MHPRSCVILKSTLVVGFIAQQSVVRGKCMVNRFHNVIVYFYRGTPISADNASNEAQTLCAFIVYFLHVPASWSVRMETTSYTIGMNARIYIV
jgi:hypothetical protein